VQWIFWSFGTRVLVPELVAFANSGTEIAWHPVS
jgi:hypothetical protein